jgi:hypothetical protein
LLRPGSNLLFKHQATTDSNSRLAKPPELTADDGTVLSLSLAKNAPTSIPRIRNYAQAFPHGGGGKLHIRGPNAAQAAAILLDSWSVIFPAPLISFFIAVHQPG